MRYVVIFRAEARDEALNAAEYISEQASPSVALKWYESFEKALDALAQMPQRCPYARDADAFPSIELRQLVFKSHRIIFMIRGKEVHVLHLRHVARHDIEDLT